MSGASLLELVEGVRLYVSFPFGASGTEVPLSGGSAFDAVPNRIYFTSRHLLATMEDFQVFFKFFFSTKYENIFF